MADHTFLLRLVTPQRLLLQAEATSLQVPGSEGYLGILAHHAPIITALRPGKLEVKDAAGKLTTYAVSGGFLEMSSNRATVLADAAEIAAEIDRERAAASLKRAEERLQGDGARPGSSGAGGAPGLGAPIDRERARRSLERAKNRIALASE